MTQEYHGKRVSGCDYSFRAADRLPELIGESGMTAREIAAALGRTQCSIIDLLKKLHQDGNVHISGWQRGSSGPIAPKYQWGAGTDAIKPPPYSSKQKCRRYRKTDRAKAAAKQRRVKAKIITGGLAAIDPLLAAVMGRPSTKEQTCT